MGKLSVRENPKESIHARVWVNNEDVSALCFEADSEAGYALCYIQDERTANEIASGILKFKMNAERTELLTERLEGKVRIDVNGKEW